MFIYEFMGGVLEVMGRADTGDPDETDYDPHHHRRVEKPTSYSETMTHMLKGSIGAGILAMPDGYRRMGLIAGTVGLWAIGAFATYCIHMLAALQSGPPCMRGGAVCMGRFVNAMLIIWQLGLCCVYSVFVAENVKQVCDYYGYEISLRLHILIGFVPLVILNMVKSLKLLSPMSSISNVITLLGFILVFYYLMETDLVIEPSMFKPKSLEDFPVFVGVTLFALEAVGVILALEYNMEHPKRFIGYCGLFNVSMIIILCMYGAVGAFGYMKYGADIKASITLNLPYYDKKAQAAKILLAISIAVSHPLQNFVAYNQIWITLSKKYEGAKRHLIDYSLRVILVVIPVALAVAIPDLGPTISLVGALCLSLLALLFPALIDICIWYPDKYGLFKYKLFRDIIIMILGMLALVSGVYTSILELLK